MSLDIRIPTGLLFAAIGVILTCFGLVSDAAIYERSLGVNVNLWWGLVVLAFGLFMLWMASRASRRTRASESGPPAGDRAVGHE